MDKRKEEQREASAIAVEAMGDRTKVVEVIARLSELNTRSAIMFIGGLSELTIDAKIPAIEALKNIGTADAAQRLGWMAYDHHSVMADELHSDADIILEALRSFDPEIAGPVIKTIENRQFERSAADLHEAVNHKDKFNRCSRGTLERFDIRISNLALKIVAPEQLEKHLQDDSAIPDLRKALQRAVASVPSLKEIPQVKTALEHLSLKL